MFHHTARTVELRLAFRTWEEGLALFHRLVRGLSGIVAICIMPNHVHVLVLRKQTARLQRLLGEHTRWLNHRRGIRGRLWEGVNVDAVHHGKIARVERYVFLNPCRFPHLVDDPLDWPLFSYRDALGLVVEPTRARVEDTAAFHSFVSNDGTVRIGGTSLPVGNLVAPSLREVEAAVSSASRTTRAGLRKRGPARDLLVRAARELCEETVVDIASFAGVGERTVYRARRGLDRPIQLVSRIAGDRRFAVLHDHDLLGFPELRWYRERGFR